MSGLNFLGCTDTRMACELPRMLLGLGEYQQLTHRNLYPTAKSWVLGAVSPRSMVSDRLLRASAAHAPASPPYGHANPGSWQSISM